MPDKPPPKDQTPQQPPPSTPPRPEPDRLKRVPLDDSGRGRQMKLVDE
jgi:hypothetical protein